MEQLSSCYFCGAALDAQIEPYKVIPPQLEPSEDQQRAVALCPTCRQKLGQVVETVVAATGASPPTTAGDDVTAPDPAGELLGPAESSADAAPSDSVREQVAAGDDVAAPPDSGDAMGSRSTEESGGDDSERSADETDETTREASAGTIERTRNDTDRGQENGTANDDEPTDPLSTDASATDEQSVADEDPDRDSGTTGETTATDDDGPSLTALEYNKVMRLLQNRDFPVERAEIHEVATSAYQVSDREFDAIIDAAIERGLIDEENGQLVSGD